MQAKPAALGCSRCRYSDRGCVQCKRAAAEETDEDSEEEDDEDDDDEDDEDEDDEEEEEGEEEEDDVAALNASTGSGDADDDDMPLVAEKPPPSLFDPKRARIFFSCSRTSRAQGANPRAPDDASHRAPLSKKKARCFFISLVCLFILPICFIARHIRLVPTANAEESVSV